MQRKQQESLPDHYKVLGLPKDATEAAIKLAYRKLALIWHPDKHSYKKPDDKFYSRKECEAVFKQINEANEVLSDKVKRTHYDALLKSEQEEKVKNTGNFLDYYYVLGIPTNATEEVIKQAYRKLADIWHPDKYLIPKLGNKLYSRNVHEMISKQLKEAYDVLSDGIKRANYDTTRIAGYLPAGITPPFSKPFRESHKKAVSDYQNNTSFREEHKKIEIKTEPFKSDMYTLQIRGNQTKYFHDIFSFIEARANQGNEEKIAPIKSPITIENAVKIFIDFLSGQYYGTGIVTISDYLTQGIKRVRSEIELSPEIKFYEGMLEVIHISKNQAVNALGLIEALVKIVNFAKNTSEATLLTILPLFYSKYFRNLCAFSLHLFWQSDEGLFCEENLKKFDGRTEAEDLLDNYKSKARSNSEDNNNITKLIRHIKLLLNFEHDLHKPHESIATAESYRNKAFHLLDWMGVLIDLCEWKVRANMFLQIGIQFQIASRLGISTAMQYADEMLALEMYNFANKLSKRASPDVEIYCNSHVLRFMSVFKFQHPVSEKIKLEDIISSIKKRVLTVTDIFPFFETYQSNVTLFKQENSMMHLMRNMLQALIKIHRENKLKGNKLLDHPSVAIFYQAYEACLKNWYQDQYEPEVEKEIRLETMEALLKEKGWEFKNDIEKRLCSPEVMIDRDSEGWMRPSTSCPFPTNSKFVVFSEIHGAEVNSETGEITFFLEKWVDKSLSYDNGHEKRFSEYDIQEMLEKNLGSAFFSLDPIPDKPYHPFNEMRFGPSRLYGSELLNTMLLADYMLKFFTTYQEVQGKHPFAQRSIENMIQHLPPHLRKIIDDFHQADRPSGRVHRFWIEADEVDVTFNENKAEEKNNITRFRLDNHRMIVKKHLMKRDTYGNLVDDGNEDEGWPIYVLTPEQMQELERGRRIINGHAMIFIYGTKKLVYWENNSILHTHMCIGHQNKLSELFEEVKEPNGQVRPNSKNMSLLYRITRDMAKQTGIEHRLSAEFVFAQEFTIHYDEFAQYFPEFGRLRELSKVSVVVRILDRIRQMNKEKLEAISSLIDFQAAAIPTTEIYQEYKRVYDTNYQNIVSYFDRMRGSTANSVLKTKWHGELSRIKNAIGNLNLSAYSPEVNDYCQHWHDSLVRLNPHIPSSRIWNEVVNPKRFEKANELSREKREACQRSLKENFSSRVSSSNIDALIETFLNGNIAPLADALTSSEKLEAHKAVRDSQFPNISLSEVGAALDDNGSFAASNIAKAELRRDFSQLKESLNKVESSFLAVNFAKSEEEQDLTNKCIWVPASVRHDVRKDDTTGLTTYSFYVYGGVNLQSRITSLYQVVNADGSHGKFGITVNPATRYSARQLDGGTLHVLAEGSRKQMLQTERYMHETIPPGNREGARAHKIYAAIQRGWQADPRPGR